MSKLKSMINKNNKDVTYVLVIAFVLVIVSMLFVNRGTYSVDENVNTDNIVLDCPDSVIIGGSIECSINVNLVTMTAYGINAKYNIPEGVEFVEFNSENWEIYSNEKEGFVLVNLDGVVGSVPVGVVKFTMPSDAIPKKTYTIELTDISLGDGEETILNLDNVSDEVRIKSNINTLDNVTITDVTLNESFDKDKVEYTGKTNADKVNISVVKTDEYSSVSGDIGEKDIHYGTNKFSIVVTSEDGNTKTYSFEIYKEYKFSTDKYVYSEDDNYLYVGDGQSLIANIDIPEELSKEVKDNKLIISYKDEVLKEIDLIIVSSDLYDLDKEYIYLGTSKLDLSKISIVNGQVIEEDNKLVVKYGTDVLDSRKLVKISSSTYDLSKEYIYWGTSKLDLSKISIVNGQVIEEDNKLVVKYGTDVLDSRKLVKISSSTYDLSKEYIYLGTSKLDLSKISIVNGQVIEEDNKLVVKYGTDVLDSRKLVKISSSTYDLSKEYIYLGTSKLDLSKISIVNGQVIEEDNKLVFKYGTDVIDEIDIVSVDLGNLYVDNDVITLDDYLSYEEFVSNIKGNVSYKIFNGDNEVKDGDITEEMILKLYYEGIELDSFDINIYDLSFNDNIIVNEDKGYVKFKKEKSSIKEFLTNLDVVGDVKIFVSDKDGNEKSEDDLVVTGDTLTVYVGSEKIDEYKIAVRGDANGDGKVSSTDLIQIRKHIVGYKNPTTGEVEIKTGIYLYAIDMNDNDDITSTDLVRMRRVIVGIDIDE